MRNQKARYDVGGDHQGLIDFTDWLAQAQRQEITL
jgi:hypothetical protein